MPSPCEGVSGAYSSVLSCCPMCPYASSQMGTRVWPGRVAEKVLSRHRGWGKQQVGSEGQLVQERWVWGLLVVAVVGLGPGESQVDMARAGVCSGLVLTTEA